MTDSKQGSSSEKQKDDLSTILTTEEQIELTLLIANITEVMRKQITETFDASITSAKPPAQALHVGNKNPNIDESKAHEETEEEEKARKLQAKREKELSAPKMKELKKDALEFFDKWRESIILRLGQVVNNPKEVVDEKVKEASAEATPNADPPTETKVLRRNTNIEEADAALVDLYPPTSTHLYSLPKDKRIILLHAMLLLLLSLEHYIAHSRILLLHISSSLHLPLHILSEQEVKVAQGLLEAAKRMSGSEETQKRSDDNKVARRWKVGLAGVAGAAVIGVTGGLAAPLVAGAIGTIMGGLGLGATTAAGLLGALAESGVIVGSLFGAYGAGMTSKMMDAYAKEVEDFAFLPLKGSKHQDPKPEDRRLRVTIGISGWLTQKEDIITPWRALGHESEVFALRWELEALTLGARMIYSCLMSLAERRAFGLVESAVLVGTPAPSDAAPWRAMRSVVSGRLINVYSENDYILAFLYRTSSIQYGVAGLQEVQDVKGIENVNVSDMVSGHLRLQYLAGSILEKIGFEDIDKKEVAREEETLALLEEQDRKEEEEKKGEAIDPDEEAAKMEKEVEKKSERTMMQNFKEKLHFK
ncbi:putative membrane protein C6F6.13c [Lachnellula cervina]|uniref:Putative membrane protein C6F6.13c n=1 Tax=Lachnellula cervina TaxID=1316786 RepID=A0A7D8USZ5_9HELO|nr:putative membrane protein C6F6.13c [Lachnellula cervina]